MTNPNFTAGKTSSVAPVRWAIIHVDFESSRPSENSVVADTPFASIHFRSDLVDHLLPVVGGLFPDSVESAAIESRSIFIDFFLFVVAFSAASAMVASFIGGMAATAVGGVYVTYLSRAPGTWGRAWAGGSGGVE